MLPLIVIGIRRGLSWESPEESLCDCQLHLDYYSFHWGTFIFDYLLAFGSLGLSGPPATQKYGLFILAFVGVGLLRWVMRLA